MTEYHYILDSIGKEEVLSQLEEECAELIHAASKLRRAISDKNPTPVTAEIAENMIIEELADLILCAKVLGYRADSIAVERIQEDKLYRWITRINKAKGD